VLLKLSAVQKTVKLSWAAYLSFCGQFKPIFSRYCSLFVQ
jgi:hypothetical protein